MLENTLTMEKKLTLQSLILLSISFLLISCSSLTKSNPDTFVVGMLDSGVEVSHKYLKTRLIVDDEKKQDLTGENSLSDYSGHGTHVAGILVTNLDESINIFPIKNIGTKGLKKETSIHDEEENSFLRVNLALDEAIDLVINHNIKVLNVSQKIKTYNQKTIDALKRAQKSGLIIVAGAGNFMINLSDPTYSLSENGPFPCSFKETHGFDNIICVGSYMEVDDNLSPVFSNFGKVIDIWAWGNTVYSSDLNNTFDYRRGTSMATPKVTAYIANFWKKNPHLKYADVINKVFNSLPKDDNLAKKSRNGTYLPEEFRFFHPKIQAYETTSN